MNSSIEEEMILSPRDKIYSVVAKNPGLHFREIQRRVNYATGAMQYHLDYLKKKGYVKEEKEGKFSRFYVVDSNANPKIMNLLRQDQVRVILLFLLNKRRATIKVISKSTQMSVSTLNFHLKKLIDSGVVVEVKQKDNVFYLIKNKEPIIEHLIVYKKSFLDELVENFASIWEEELGL